MPTDGVTTEPRRSTIADVAALAKVDRSVVSRLINDDPGLRIRDSTRQRVLDAIAMLGYRPNVMARSLRTARTRTIGLLIPDFANPIYTEIIKGAERAATKAGSLLVTGSLTAAPDASPGTYLRLLGHGRVDGLLLLTSLSTEAEQAELDRLRLPWLQLNRTSTGGRRQIILDETYGSIVAVEHLSSLGHRRIGYLTGPRGGDTYRRRGNAYRSAMRQAGLPIEPALMVNAEYGYEGGARGFEQIMRLPSPPTAVLVDNLTTAVGCLHAARKLAVSIPGTVSVIAKHDLPIAAYLDPPLTMVRMPMQRLGEYSLERLLNTEANAKINEILREPTELVVRESTAPPRAN